MKAAVLLIAWRRPHTTRQVIDAVREYSPDRFYVACDGPSLSRPGEQEKVSATRDLIEKEVDWPCRTYHLFSNENQGCSLGPTRAISWFFENEAEGIILEDDCVPHPDFFLFCENLLNRYRDDQRIWCISGINLQDGSWRGEASYYFSRFAHCWGWASWRSRWRFFDGDLSLWPTLVKNDYLGFLFADPVERSYWSDIWWRTNLHSDTRTWWDYQWFFACLTNAGLTALPNKNLITNIGFGADATHTTDDRVSHVATEGLGELIHPDFFLGDEVADRHTFENHIAGKHLRYKASLRGRILDPLLAKFHTAFKQPLHYPKKCLRILWRANKYFGIGA
jgi:hypothetical protein